MFNDMFDNFTSSPIKTAHAMTFSRDDNGLLVRTPENFYDVLYKQLSSNVVDYQRSADKTLLKDNVNPILSKKEITPLIETISTSTKDTNIKPEWVAALLFKESSGSNNPNITGDDGKAKGITQIWDVTWDDKRYQTEFLNKYGRKPSRSSTDDQVRMGTIILNQLYNEWNGNIEYMFRAYNSGSASLKQQLDGKRKPAAASSTAYWNEINKLLNQ